MQPVIHFTKADPASRLRERRAQPLRDTQNKIVRQLAPLGALQAYRACADLARAAQKTCWTQVTLDIKNFSF